MGELLKHPHSGKVARVNRNLLRKLDRSRQSTANYSYTMSQNLGLQLGGIALVGVQSGAYLPDSHARPAERMPAHSAKELDVWGGRDPAH